MMAVQLDLIPRYQQLRLATSRIAHLLTQYLSRNAINEAGGKLGILHKGTLVFDSEGETAVLMDYAIHDVREHGANALERCLMTSPPVLDPADLAILRQMAKARFSLFIVESTEPGIGLHLRDLLNDEAVFMVDINFSKSVQTGLILASRIITVDGISMSTGAGLPVAVVPPGEKNHLLNEFVSRFKALADRAQTPQAWSDFTGQLIQACLEQGASSRVRYADPDEEIDAEPRPSQTATHSQWASKAARQKARAAQNKRCPCGSGRKFKNCCGGRQ